MADPEMRGYFDDGTTVVGLDGWATAHIASFSSPVVRLSGAGFTEVEFLPTGGDTQIWRVRGLCDRYNVGDGEWYAYQKAIALLAQNSGTLGITMGAVTTKAYGSLWFRSGQWQVPVVDLVYYELDFIRGTPKHEASEPAYNAAKLQAAPGEYGGRSNGWAHAVSSGASNIVVGDHSLMTVRCDRDTHLARMGRAYGCRVIDNISGKAIYADLAISHDDSNQLELEANMDALTRLLQGNTVTLTGNGNTFSSVVCDSLSNEAFEDQRVGSFSMSFSVPVS